MNKIINIRDAKVRTATVQIRTLTITNKQVTLAVFRQLKEEEILQGNGKLKGIPWGIVNYHPDDCKKDREHIHIVWQKGKELRRNTISERQYSDSNWDVHQIKYKENKDKLFKLKQLFIAC